MLVLLKVNYILFLCSTKSDICAAVLISSIGIFSNFNDLLSYKHISIRQ
jgi:hypothetical protein